MNNLFNKKYRIYYEDTDAIGVVYYANYLKFAERVRTDWLREIVGLKSQNEFSKKYDISFVVSQVNVKYKSPAVLDDIIEVDLCVNKITKFKLILNQTIKTKNNVCCEIEVTIAAVKTSSKKLCPLPEIIYNEHMFD